MLVDTGGLFGFTFSFLRSSVQCCARWASCALGVYCSQVLILLDPWGCPDQFQSCVVFDRVSMAILCPGREERGGYYPIRHAIDYVWGFSIFGNWHLGLEMYSCKAW